MSSDHYFQIPLPPPPPPGGPPPHYHSPNEEPQTPGGYSRSSLISEITMTDAFVDEDAEEDSMIYSEDPESNRTPKYFPEYANVADEVNRRNPRKKINHIHKIERSFTQKSKGASRFRRENRPNVSNRLVSFTREGVPPGAPPELDNLQIRSGKKDVKRAHLNSVLKKENARTRPRHTKGRENKDNGAGNWMKQLASSFRSPSPPSLTKAHHRRTASGSMQSYPHFPSSGNLGLDEESPLLSKINSMPDCITLSSVETDLPNDYVSIAAAYLRDYEANRPPSFEAHRFGSISQREVQLYHFRYGNSFYPFFLMAATVALFFSSFLEGFSNNYLDRILLTNLNVFALAVCAVDVIIRLQLYRPRNRGSFGRGYRNQREYESRRSLPRSSAQRWVQPLVLFGVVLIIENFARLIVTPDDSLVLFSSLFKPLILYYVSRQGRETLEVLSRVIRSVGRVILMELLIILMFAVIACHLFHKYDEFRNLGTSWISLFELSTTVVNPSIWMPIYETSQGSAFFFVIFVVVSVFYLHTLALSVVFQSHIHAVADIRQRYESDRDETVKLAFMALRYHQEQFLTEEPKSDSVNISLVRETLRIIRPHYNALKINALVEIVAPANQQTVDYPTFRTKIRQALNASIRTARSASPMAMATELIAAVVAIINFVYVIIVSYVDGMVWFGSAREYIGCCITLLAGIELLVRFNPFRLRDFTPLTRLNATFDGAALAAVLTSCYGAIMFLAGYTAGAEYILVGRAIDMLRIMRFFQSFRDLIRRSSDVFPSLVGPLILVVTTIHAFVYTGMGLWGGSVTVGLHRFGKDTVMSRFDLNNFNSYREGVITMFEITVVNSWNKLADVFLNASRCSSPWIVYTFFVLANLICVSIMLNVLTAFFVETFVTKFNDDTDGPAEATATVHKDREHNGHHNNTNKGTPESAMIRKKTNGSLSSEMNNTSKNNSDNNGSDHDADSEGSSASELYEFDVYEREGFDKIMQTFAGSQPEGHFGRLVCSYFDVFEHLCPGRETVGWLMCDQQTLDRYGNRRFQTKAEGFLSENELQLVVSNMHTELLALAPKASFQDSSLLRRFPHGENSGATLEIAASLLRRHPALSLFVSRVVDRPDLETDHTVIHANVDGDDVEPCE